MSLAHLSQYLPPDAGSEAYRRVLARLGDDIAAIAAELRLRPTAATRIDSGGEHVLVRLSTASEHVLVRVAPEGDLTADLYFARALERRHLPGLRVIAADLSRSRFLFAYLVESYVGGVRADALPEAYQLRAAARQLGRLCRQIHAIPAEGWGHPTLRRSWSAASWPEALATLRNDAACEIAGRLVFGAETQARMLAALDGLGDAEPPSPRLLHGALGPACMIVTPGEQTQVMAIVEPGPIIGGDPLLDLAQALSPSHPAPFVEGFLSGYRTTPLTPEEEQRLGRLRLLCCYRDACQRYLLALPHEPSATLALELLSSL